MLIIKLPKHPICDPAEIKEQRELCQRENGDTTVHQKQSKGEEMVFLSLFSFLLFRKVKFKIHVITHPRIVGK